MKFLYTDQKHIFQKNERYGVPYLSVCGLDMLPGFVNGFSTRAGGVSEGCFSSMNLSFHKGDNPEHVKENFSRIAHALGTSPEHMVCSHQTHSTNLMRVYASDAGKGVTCSRNYRNIDGLITNVPGIMLVTSYADCVPLYFVDPVHKAIGLSHSGWRGTIGKIGKKTIDLMHREFGTDPADLYCAIGPSICRNCFEVGNEVAEKFRTEFMPEFWNELIFPQHDSNRPADRSYIDLWRANELILLQAGVHPEHLFKSNLCTRCNPELLYSHRFMGDQRGQLCAFLGIQK